MSSISCIKFISILSSVMLTGAKNLLELYNCHYFFVDFNKIVFKKWQVMVLLLFNMEAVQPG